MKKLVQIALASIVLMSFTIATPVAWQTDTIDVGKIPQGTPKTVEFSFKNTGDKEVVITNVKTSCGCTASDYTKEAIKPGKTGFVKAIYNAATKGSFTKTVTVTTNIEETPKILTLKGEVN